MDTHISSLKSYGNADSGDDRHTDHQEEVAEKPQAPKAKRVALPGESEQGEHSKPVAEVPLTSGPSTSQLGQPTPTNTKGPLAIAGLVVACITTVGVYLATTHHHHPVPATFQATPPVKIRVPSAAIQPSASAAAIPVALKPPPAQGDMHSLMALQANPPVDAPVAPTEHPAPPAILKPAAPAVAVVPATVEARPAAGVKPMTQQQQADVLQMLTRVAALVRDLRVENGVRQQQLDLLAKTTAERLDDFNNRLSFAEAHKAVEGAADAVSGPPAETNAIPASAATASRPATAIAQRNVAAAVEPAVAPVAARNLSDYRLQAASPGLAVLQVSASGMNEPGILQIASGDNVPGLGRVISITQHGATWEVRTDRGVIR